MAKFSVLPTELKLHILVFLPERGDLNSLSRCDRATYWLSSDILLSNSFARRSKARSPDLVFKEFFVYAVNHDSRNIAKWLVFHTLNVQLRTSFLTSTAQVPSISYLHFAILNDAPQVAVELAKNGADIHDLSDHPDLEALYLGISMPQMQPNSLNRQLHIACAYALPRTTQYLLARGADPNHLSRFGLAPLHSAVRSRPPWRHFSRAKLIKLQETKMWQSLVVQTTSTILNFGGDPNLKSQVSRLHNCGSQCWRSPDCGHRGQTPLHFACAGGIDAVVNLLLQHGANLASYDEEGYLPLYSAMSQGHIDVSFRLLRWYVVPSSIIVVRPSQSTALHIAARFGLETVVRSLLNNCPTVNIKDSDGKTPRDEAMAQRHHELESCISQVLDLLSTHGSLSKSPLPKSERNFNTCGTADPERDSNGLALDQHVTNSDTEPVDEFKGEEQDVAISSSHWKIQQRTVTMAEPFPPLRSESSVSNRPVLSSANSPWWNEEKRKSLFIDPRVSARHDVGPNPHSAKFWAALHNQTHGQKETSAPLLSRQNDRQFASDKKKNRKWSPLHW